jgi:hypothetical protein
MAEIPMTTFICRWCGAPYALAAAMAENGFIEKRCPSGHRHSDGTTVQDRLRESERASDERCGELAKLRATIVNLKGQITKLKAKR